MTDQFTAGAEASTPARKPRGRPRGAEATRTRILDAATALIVDSGYTRISLDHIAEQAGVSRRTIYDQFGSKRGVLEGITNRMAEEGLPELLGAVRQAKDPVEALRKSIPLSVDFTGRNVRIVLIFYAQAINDPDFRAAWDLAQQNRWNNLRRIVDWLAREGLLAEGWTLDHATDWLHYLTSYQLYDELVVQRGWSHQEMAEKMMRDINAMLLVGGDDAPEQAPEASTVE